MAVATIMDSSRKRARCESISYDEVVAPHAIDNSGLLSLRGMATAQVETDTTTFLPMAATAASLPKTHETKIQKGWALMPPVIFHIMLYHISGKERLGAIEVTCRTWRAYSLAGYGWEYLDRTQWRRNPPPVQWLTKILGTHRTSRLRELRLEYSKLCDNFAYVDPAIQRGLRSLFVAYRHSQMSEYLMQTDGCQWSQLTQLCIHHITDVSGGGVLPINSKAISGLVKLELSCNDARCGGGQTITLHGASLPCLRTLISAHPMSIPSGMLPDLTCLVWRNLRLNDVEGHSADIQLLRGLNANCLKDLTLMFSFFTIETSQSIARFTGLTRLVLEFFDPYVYQSTTAYGCNFSMDKVLPLLSASLLQLERLSLPSLRRADGMEYVRAPFFLCTQGFTATDDSTDLRFTVEKLLLEKMVISLPRLTHLDNCRILQRVPVVVLDTTTLERTKELAASAHWCAPL